VFCALMVSSPGASRAATDTAGTISLLEGDVTLTAQDGTRRAPAVNGAIASGDTITTGADGELQAQMEDGGMIAVRPNSVFRIDAYRAEGEADDESAFTLLKGAVRSVTGFIGKVNTANYAIRTPTATIGVRGTDHEVLHIPEGEAQADETPGTHDRVYSGETVINTAQGSLPVQAGQVGYADARRHERPRLHRGIPRFIERRRTRHEAFIERHEQEVGVTIEKQLRKRGKLQHNESWQNFIQRKRYERRERLQERNRPENANLPQRRLQDHEQHRPPGNHSRRPEPYR
jgi:hypothetical protein